MVFKDLPAPVVDLMVEKWACGSWKRKFAMSNHSWWGQIFKYISVIFFFKVGWLIDWCLTPTLAIFQLYRGVMFFSSHSFVFTSYLPIKMWDTWFEWASNQYNSLVVLVFVEPLMCFNYYCSIICHTLSYNEHKGMATKEQYESRCDIKNHYFESNTFSKTFLQFRFT
jgi:hypothetical protein